MSCEIVPFVDGNDSTSAEVVVLEHLTDSDATSKQKAVVVEHLTDSDAILRRQLGTIEEDVRPFDLLGLRSLERLHTRKGYEVEADLISGSHEMMHFLPPKKGPKCVTKLNPKPEFVKPLLEKIKEPSVLQLRGCDQLFSPDAYPFSFEKFKTLTCLEISGVSNLTTFPENTISKMTQLQILNLSHLPIPQLPTYFFSNLVHLLSLTLKDCPNIHSLPKFPEMTALEYLELSHLPIQQLPDNFFYNFVHLRSLTLKDWPNICSLPEFPDMVALEYLELSHLLIATLPYQCNFCFEELKRLILRGCYKLSSIPSFERLLELRELDLSHCTALQEIELEDLPQYVEKLDLSYTALPKLPVRSTITHLFVRDAKVIDFLGFYDPLIHLKVLDVSGARFVKHLDLLKESEALEALDLSRTSMEFESIDFISFMVNLRYLILRDCTWLQKLPAMKNLTRLEVLDTSGCEILDDLPEDFSSLKKLKELNLSGCSGLKELSPSLFNGMTSLEKVDISKTNINHLSSFVRLTNLRTLNISQTSVKEVPTCLQTVTSFAAAPESGIENLHPRLPKPNEFYIVSSFFINSGFDRFLQYSHVIVDLIKSFQKDFKPVSSLDTIPISYERRYLIYGYDSMAKTDAESCPISGQTVEMQCSRMVADLEYIRANIGLLESCPNSISAEKLLDELTDARSQFQPWVFEHDSSDQSLFYFRLNSTNFYEVLRRVTNLKQLVPRKQVDALEEQKNKEKLEGRLEDEQQDIIYIDINASHLQQLISSYESLTKTEKICLLHFTFFCRFSAIKERMLIELWYGEGLIDPQHEENTHSTANPLPTPNQNLDLELATIYSDSDQETMIASIEAALLEQWCIPTDEYQRLKPLDIFTNG